MSKKLKIRKCHICGAMDYHEAKKQLSEEEFDKLDYEDKLSETTECSYCEKVVCDQDSCREEFNDGDQCGCNECIKTWTKYDCDKCTIAQDECPFNREYGYCYECPEYTEEEPKND
jgi:hypothetical protein